MLCLVKTIFFCYNFGSNNSWEIHSISEAVTIFLWSLYYDLVCMALISLPYFLLSLVAVKNRLLLSIGAWLSVALTIFAFLLNAIDIFYFPFHHQRADADLLYVIRNPLNNGAFYAWLIIAAILLLIIFSASYLWKHYNKFVDISTKGQRFYCTAILLCCIIVSLFTGRSKKMIPTRPLTDVTSLQLPLTQNSFQSFLYSMYRSSESVIPSNQYMGMREQEALFTINKSNKTISDTPKNIVLFIMESVPYEFFDSTSRFKPRLPFLDSLVELSTFYNNAFSYSYNSNKGITALLTGIPTITDIPLYHSGFSSLSKTDLGKTLAEKNYHSSFYIGDNYDDFGFAKCCNWAGIQHYFCMQDIPGYKKMEKHSLGLQDEYVLDFMQQQLQKTTQPFFATQYNISTHFPNDLTVEFAKKTKDLKIPAALKSMMYYDACLSAFFTKASRQPWFYNTVFIFCSDHWASPDESHSNDIINSFRIPILIFNPAQNKKETINNMVSQLDVMNTILAFAGIKDTIKSYGSSLLDSADRKRIVFTKINNAVYQAINSEYVLGFNAEEGKALYCYQYQSDRKRERNLLPEKSAMVDSLQQAMKAFLQTASNHYRSRK